MAVDINLNKEDANYSWKCPYCDKEAFTKYNKSCFYQIVDHCKEEHLDQTFTDIIKRHSVSGKKQMLDNNWNFFSRGIKSTNQRG